MRRNPHILQAVSTGLAMAGLLAASVVSIVQADSAVAPSLVISQLKITSSNGQFVTLYNATNGALDMSKYQLEYFNSYDLSKATSSRLISLQGTLPPHSYYQINDSSLLLCYQITINSQSLGFSSTAGLVAVVSLNQMSPGGSVVPTMQDVIGWSKTAAPGAQTLPTSTAAFLQRQPVDGANNPLVPIAGSGSWLAVQPDPKNACGLVTYATTPIPIQTGLSQLLTASEPPASIIETPDSDDVIAVPTFPAADIGLMAPKITELLPNPDGTGNDATDEYIEVYNPNAAAFDLTGFSLQTGLTTLRNYKFPAGSLLNAKAFVAFYSADTGLSLSNTAGQARLLDPFGSAISNSDQYASAKDGQAWALANGKWYFTTQATPSAANVIKLPPTTKKKAAANKAKGTTVATKKLQVKSATSAKTQAPFTEDPPSTTPIHVWTLALVVGAAVLYGAYEYRTDMANRIHQFKRHVGNR